ncbi:MAG: hypothetical protein TH68_06715 [Candidatus Synechococcus spongiarum 142]|uniref:Uncharacterized protein n=1 Tax=Candidatus Synechococcus spongiarum 142 TaxID=1608213 RepID=A0A6N3X434_9SYNE|nr:MAG: hypothetical protein TH68_06715 [Candidatus Synechococcus spongiarum 142]
MTSSGPSQQQPDNQQPKDGRLRQLGQLLWDNLSLKRYREIRKDSEKEIRKKLEDNERNRILQNLEENIVITLEKIKLLDETEENIGKAKDDLDKAKNKLEEQTAKLIRQQVYNLKTHKSMENQLQKLQSFIITFPIILVIFGIVFSDRVKDIMEIDVLRTKIERLEKDMNSSQPNGWAAGSSVCQPGDEICCSSDDGFFSC